ncbi:F0F1 ATP synthase subunit gamma [Levilactobacillus parabrevis]|uniref:ATP synthase gamma chain n=1 Tax=Levilactobacillus parabrevis ATCC 53295 TaxID=1267003 RepID=A0A0R1GZY3_9LACO|nr:F0F1 ATP synthase subunit gamma [Levilactobacillus parabrevis]KRK39765.1 F0F1-type ATP synthase, gamma subunit [Levilactobacillus parabrevis ATCC 53295]KRO07066.1 F0F1-type ATP synthase, gamma subunit [Levilactobacillus parabrevis]MCT4486676.1 F0F1 ATP synthase subunit gamma [Levilactobacillus parabrevis]MCT4489343.1 F0F1 ATP synthase subunit gamma [Levilactobacillus parabrevis]
MAESIHDVQRRITSTKATRQITAAMHMVSTAKLNKIQKHAVGYQDYVSKVKAVVMHLSQSHLLDNSSSSLQSNRPVKKTAYLVITSDRGMVGSYNSSVLREANTFIKERTPNPDDYMVLAVGGTGADFYRNRGINVAYEYRGVSDVPEFNEVREIVKTVTTMFDNEVFDQLFVCYNHFVNRISSRFRAEKMLPVDKETLSTDAANDTQAAPLTAEYDTEPSEEEVLQVVLPQYAESLVYGAILDAKTSEHASSSNAMQSATDNADDLIGTLQLHYNRARQAAITTEITEITGGQEALNN